MSTNVKKKSVRVKATPEMVKERANFIKNVLWDPSRKFELELAIKQMVAWSTAKRRQVFRQILKMLLTSSFAPPRTVFMEYGVNYWMQPLHAYKSKALHTFIEIIKELEKESRFIPEKIYTIQTLQNELFLINPRDIEYLFTNNIVELSDNLKVSKVRSGLFINDTYSILHQPGLRMSNQKKIFEDFGLTPENFLDIYKNHSLLLATAYSNMVFFIDKFIKKLDKEKLTNNHRFALEIMIENLEVLMKVSSTDIEKLLRYGRSETVAKLFETRVKKHFLEFNYIDYDEFTKIKNNISILTANEISKARESFLKLFPVGLGAQKLEETSFDPFAVHLAD